jgi:thiol-disulfide isomerase/thioredoxin
MKSGFFLFLVAILFQSCTGQTNSQFKEDSDIRFINEPIDNCDSLLSKYKGKPVFVDIWATWCLPCRREFKHVGFLKEMAADSKMIVLFISGDKDADSLKWKKIVYENNLKGYHIRMNSQLKADIIKRFSRPLKSNGEIALIYPTYLIVNKDAHVVNTNAPKPSEKNQLTNELSAVLN